MRMVLVSPTVNKFHEKALGRVYLQYLRGAVSGKSDSTQSPDRNESSHALNHKTSRAYTVSNRFSRLDMLESR